MCVITEQGRSKKETLPSSMLGGVGTSDFDPYKSQIISAFAVHILIILLSPVNEQLTPFG